MVGSGFKLVSFKLSPRSYWLPVLCGKVYILIHTKYISFIKIYTIERFNVCLKSANPLWPNYTSFCCAKSLQSYLTLCDLMDCIAHQTLLSLGFSRQGYWSGLPLSSPQDLPDPGIEPVSLMSLALAGRFFTTSATWEALSWGHFLSISDAWQDLEVKTCHLPSHPGFPRETWRSLSKVKVTLGALPPHGTRLRGQTTLGWPRPL